MKLLLDENLSRRLLTVIESHFARSTHVCLAGLERASDLQIWDYAKQHELTIVTCDSDFHEMSLIRGAPPKVIWLHAGNLSTAQIAERLINAKEQILSMLAHESVRFVELTG